MRSTRRSWTASAARSRAGARGKPERRPRGQETPAPASISNLGPGFDTLGVAVSLYLRVRVAAVVEDGRGRLECRFSNGPLGGPNRIEEAFRNGSPPKRQLPSLVVDVRSDIPLRSGLGSSAAATIAGLRLRDLVDGTRTNDELLRNATEIEGHPDNVAPALYGGFTVAYRDREGFRAVAVSVDPRVGVVAFVPPDAVETSLARGLLPASVPHADAAANAGRAALLVAALSRQPELLLAATEDRLHQPYRAEAMPRSAALLAELRERGVPAVVSGAGPTVLALTTAATRDEGAAISRRGWTVMPLDVDTDGATLVPLETRRE